MTDPARLDETAIAIGQMREFMLTTRTSLVEVRSSVDQTRSEMHQHRMEAKEANIEHGRDIADIRMALDELHACVKSQHKSKGKWHAKSIAVGGVAAVFCIALITLLMAGQDGDLLATLTRLMGLLL